VRIKLATFNVEGLFRGLETRDDRSPSERRTLAERVLAIDADVVGLQGVDDRGALDVFRRLGIAEGGLADAYPFGTALEGNDRRGAALGVLSRLPVGAVTTWHHVRSPEDPSQPAFTRDLLEAQIFSDEGHAVLSLYVTHLPDALSDAGAPGDLLARRGAEASMLRDILAQRGMGRRDVVVMGTMGAAPDAVELRPLTLAVEVPLVDGLRSAVESPPFAGSPAPDDERWTVRTPNGTGYGCWDHIWLSPRLARYLVDAGIGRRLTPDGDATRHDPAWVTLDITRPSGSGPRRRSRVPVTSSQRVRFERSGGPGRGRPG
jgi:endonuclease/exonuclease/phosphatase family metal-dependent hydrolase